MDSSFRWCSDHPGTPSTKAFWVAVLRKPLLINTKELQKLAILAVNQKDSRRKINTLIARIEAMCQKDGILVDSELHQDLVAIVGESQQALPNGSFRKLFWEQQVKALQNKDPRQRRWHLLIIKWRLNLKMMSSSAYHTM